MRVLACLLAILMATAACGGADDRPPPDAEGSSTTSPADGAVRTRKPLSFRPVQETLPSADCRGTTSPDTVAAHDGSACFRLGEPAVVVTRYGAEARTADGGSVPDAGAIDVTLDAGDVERFNALAAVCFERTPSCPTGQLAVVFADVVRVAPTVQEREFRGAIAISGSEDEMRELLAAMDG